MFKQEGVDAILKELKQMHKQAVLQPMDPAKLDPEIQGKALPCLMFLRRKRDGMVKGRGCADGQGQREFTSKEKASSPTVSPHASMVSSLIDVLKDRAAVTCDTPGAFPQTNMPEGENVWMKLEGTVAE